MPASDATVNGQYGTAVRRREDPPLIQGTGTYTDDVDAPGALHAHFVRSEVAHGRIVGIETEAAAAAPGVAGVFTGADLDLAPFPPGPMAPDDMLRPTLARDIVRFQGEAIAVVVAESRGGGGRRRRARRGRHRAARHRRRSRARARRRRAAAVRRQGLEPRLRGRQRPTRARSRAPTSSCAAATSTSAWPPCRWSPRPTVAVPDAETGGVRIWAPLQAPHTARDVFAGALGLEKDAVHVTVPNVGGGFGARIAAYPEQAAVAAAALRLGQARALRREPLGDDDRDAARARAGPGRRAGRAQRRHAGRHPRPRDRRLRRLSRRRGDHALPHRPDGLGRLPHPARGLRLSLRGDQHDADRRLPRRRAPRGDRARSSAPWTSWPPSSTWTRPSCAGATSSRPTTSRTRRSPAPPTTRASTRARWSACSRPPATTSCARSRRSGASAATCKPARDRPVHLRRAHRASASRSARAPSTRTASSRSRPAPRRRARATRRRGRSSCRGRSACRWTTCASSTPTRARSRAAWGRWARARCRSAAAR